MAENDIDQIQAEVEARKKEERETSEADAKKEDPITPAFVYDCLNANRLGDGALFSALNQGQFLSNLSAKDEWYRWADHYWELDTRNTRFSKGVEGVVAKYNEEVDRLNEEIKKAREAENKDRARILAAQRDGFKKRINSLRDVGADKCLTWATRVENCLGIRGEEFDRNAWLLACRNGVIELRTGKFRPGRPEDHITKATPHDWHDFDAPRPMFKDFLDAVFESNAELIGFAKRFFGYGLLGAVPAHAFAILYGEGGRNGKGTLVETLQHVLGAHAGPIQSEMLLDQKTARSASAPTPDIMTLKGLRIAFASETDEGRRFSAAKIKWLSGGDTLRGRHPNDKYETSFDPTHLLCLLTNHLPHAPAEDKAFWDRMHLIPFNVRFVHEPKEKNERPRVEGLKERLKEEAPGILAWLVEGNIEWQRQGLNPPDIVKDATRQYQFNEDVLGNFIAECCDLIEYPSDADKDTYEQYKVVYNAFKHWYEQTIGDNKYCPKKKKWSQLMEKRFTKFNRSGQTWWLGLKVKPEAKTDEQSGWQED